MIFLAFIVDVVMVESALMNVVVRVLMVPDDTPRVINLPATSSNVELIKIVLTTIRSRYNVLVQYCLESGPMVKTYPGRIKEPSALVGATFRRVTLLKSADAMFYLVFILILMYVIHVFNIKEIPIL